MLKIFKVSQSDTTMRMIVNQIFLMNRIYHSPSIKFPSYLYVFYRGIILNNVLFINSKIDKRKILRITQSDTTN